MNNTQTLNSEFIFLNPSDDKLRQLSRLGFDYEIKVTHSLILKDAESHALNQECQNTQIFSYKEDYDRYSDQFASSSRGRKHYNCVPVAYNRSDFANYECFTGPFTHNETSTVSQTTSPKLTSSKKKWLPAGKKADRSDPELRNLSNSYFWERRNILLQMLESYHDDEAILIKSTPKLSKTASKPKRPRGSIYRGVSKNKAKWQVMIMGNFKKMYFGAIEDEKDAALFYDKLAIVSHGIKARTNFDYTRRDIIRILNEEGLSKVWSQ